MKYDAGTTPLNPCGTLPKYIFSDSFSLYFNNIVEGTKINIAIDQTNISSEFDREHKFKKNEDASIY